MACTRHIPVILLRVRINVLFVVDISISDQIIGFGLSDRIKALIFIFGPDSRTVVGFGLGFGLGNNGSDRIDRFCRIRRPALEHTPSTGVRPGWTSARTHAFHWCETKRD